MALVTPPQHRLRTSPTSPLAQALQDFECMLTKDQKDQYMASSTKPDASSVLTFVAQIDANNKGRCRMCVAQRLCTFLDATQQFTDAVGTFVSSNPAIAALVWGGVKTTVLVVSNVASYFDKITNMIMKIGRPCSTFQEFGSLYPSSVDLQSALCQYYATVIRLCTKILEVSQRSSIVQAVSSVFQPFEADFKPLREELDEASNNIQLQISLASKKAALDEARLSEIERRKNAALRQSFSLFQKESTDEQADARNLRLQAAQRRTRKMRDAVMSNLSTLAYNKPWKQATRQRLPGTADWFEQEPAFCNWKASTKSTILWCSGTLGTGKTVLAANMVAHLFATRQSSDVVTYFFCRADLEDSCQARQILGSIAAQILECQIVKWKDEILSQTYEQSKSLDADDIVKFLLPHLQQGFSYHIVLDGLDECDKAQTQSVAKFIKHLSRIHSIALKVIYVGRPQLTQQLFGNTQPDYKLKLSQKNVDVDIKSYIGITLEDCLEDGRLRLGDPRLILRIKATLESGANGMFLWVRFLIEEICAHNTDHDIHEALHNIPRNLLDLFDRKMRRVKSMSQAERALKTLQFCGVAKRPLTVDELREALSIKIGQKSMDIGGLSNDIGQVIMDCCGLTFVDEEDRTIHYTHHSVHQHLFGENYTYMDRFDEKDLDKNLGFICLTYVNFTELGRQLVKVNQESEAKIDPLKISATVITGKSWSSIQSARLLLRKSRHSKTMTTGDLGRMAQDLLGVSGNARLEAEMKIRGFHFLAYAQKYWISHLSRLDILEDEKMWRLFGKGVDGTIPFLDRPWEALPPPTTEDSQWINTAPKDIQWLICNRHSALLVWKLTVNEPAVTDEMRGAILLECCRRHDMDTIDTLLSHTPKRASQLDQALSLSASIGFGKGVERLLEAGATTSMAHRSFTALQAAAKQGDLDMVERLITAGADVNAAAASSWGFTALQAAGREGHLGVVERLLAAGADVNAAAARNAGLTAIQAAAAGGHLYVVEILLAARADVNAAGAREAGLTALQAAAKRGRLDVVDRLLAAGGDVNASAVPDAGRTALQSAAAGGHIKVVERLLAAGANVHAPGAREWGLTALQAAAADSHLAVVERLLAAGADVNAAAAHKRGLTALQAAAKGGYLVVVERLLAAGANRNAAAAPEWGVTALQAAAAGGHLAVVERLLTAGVSFNAADTLAWIQTAQQAAAAGGHQDVATRLRQAAEADDYLKFGKLLKDSGFV